MSSVLFLALDSSCFAFLDMGLPKLCSFTFLAQEFYLHPYYLLYLSPVAEFGLTKQQINVMFDMVTEFCCNFNVTYCGIPVS